jgi:hypothetical protein
MATFRPIPMAQGINVRPGSGTWMAVGGIVHGEALLQGTPGEAGSFRPGTMSVQVVASMEEQGGTGNAHLDVVRIFALTPAEAAILSSSGGANVAGYAQTRLGLTSLDGTGTRDFQYRVQVTNASGCGASSLVSNVAMVSAESRPYIVSQPADVNVCANSPAFTLAVDVRGGGTSSYQWQTSTDGVSGWLPVPNGGTGPTLAVSPTNSGNTAITTYYRLMITNNCDTLTSRVIRVTVNPAATITSQPAASLDACDGQQGTLTVGVTGGTIQWQVNINNTWTDIPGATSSTYLATFTLADPAVGETRNFRALISSSCGAVTSNPITVTISPQTLIVSQTNPVVATCSGTPVTIGVLAQGGGLTYAWATGPSAAGPWAQIAANQGGDQPSLVVNQRVLSGAPVTTYYQATVTGACGSPVKSQVFSVTVAPPASITTALPTAVNACSGVLKTIGVVATGTANTYTWTETSPEGVVTTLPGTGETIDVPVLSPAAALNTDPSFESGTGTLVRTGGQSGSALALDTTTTAAEGSRSIRTTGGAIEMQRTDMVEVDTANLYALVASVYGEATAGSKLSVGVLCYDANQKLIPPSGSSDTRSYRMPTATSAVPMPQGTWMPVGDVIGGGDGDWNGTGIMPFRAGTKYVQFVVSLNEGATTGIGHLDNLRLTPVSSGEYTLLQAGAANSSFAQYFEARMGKVSDGNTTRSFAYQVAVNGSCAANATSTTTVNASPTIVFIAQPDNTDVCLNSSATLQAQVTGAGTLSYTWQKSTDRVNWQAIANANNTSLTVSAPTVVTYYRLQVISNCGAIFSRTVSVTPQPVPTVISSPSSVSIASGKNTLLTVGAAGQNYNIQWQRSDDGGQIWNSVVNGSAATLDTGVLTAAPGLTATRIYFRAVVSGPGCTPAVSGVAVVSVYPQPAAMPILTSQSPACSGTTVSMSAGVTSGADLTYSWQVDPSGAGTWNNVSGATASTYSATATASTGDITRYYRIVIADPAGQTAVGTPLKVVWAAQPTITQNPASTKIASGKSATLTITATGANTVYQWQRSDDLGGTWNDVPGATGTSITTSTLTAPAGNVVTSVLYRVQVAGATGLPGGNCQAQTSSVAQVDVYPMPAATPYTSSSSTVCSGSTVLIDAGPTSGVGITFKWQMDQGGGTWGDIVGSNVQVYSATATAAVTAPTVRTFRPVITDPAGQVAYGSPISITWVAQVVFTTQPSGFTVCSGGTGTLTTAYQLPAGASASGNWESSPDGSNWAPIPGATGLTYSFSNVTTSSYFRYHVVSSACGDTYSAVVQVIVKPIPLLTNQPRDASVCDGQGAILTVGTNLDPTDASYQWFTADSSNGPFSAMVGQTQQTLNLSNLSNKTGAPLLKYFRVQVNPVLCGQPITSNAATVTVRPGTVITTQPAPVDACVGTPATLRVTTTGEAVVVTWQRSDDQGATWLALPLTGTTVSIPTNVVESYSVRAVLSGACGVVYSNVVAVKVSGPTQITQQPTGTTTCQGTGLSLQVQATGAALSYAWQESTDKVSWAPVGGNSPLLAVIATATKYYRVTVTGGGGCNDSVISDVAQVTVQAIPQEVPLDVPTFALVGNSAYLAVAAGGPTYDTVTWNFQGQTYTGTSVVVPMPTSPGIYTLTVTGTVGTCTSSTIWRISVIAKGGGDANQDGRIDGADFARIMASFGLKAGQSGYDASLDMNGDGVIDQSDVDLLSASYGQSVVQGSIARAPQDPGTGSGTSPMADLMERATPPPPTDKNWKRGVLDAAA